MTTDYILHHINGEPIAEIKTTGPPISDAQQFLEIMMNSPADRLVLQKESLDESFFDLRSGLAGEILQKVANYRMHMAIVGDFSGYESKSLRDFIYESNKSNTVIFVRTLDEALKIFSI